MLILLASSLGCMTPMANLWTPAWFVGWNTVPCWTMSVIDVLVVLPEIKITFYY